jgi:predicted GNAT family N-acyltransferase
MATAESMRGQGIGALMIAETARVVYARGGRVLWCEARERAIAFYTRNGFRADGEIYLKPGAGPHRLMWRELSGSPDTSTTVTPQNGQIG